MSESRAQSDAYSLPCTGNLRLLVTLPVLPVSTIGISHDRLTACCMTYLTIKELPLAKDSSHAKNLGIHYPFLEYASTYVLRHAEEAQRRGVMQENVLQCLQKYKGFERLRRFHNPFEKNPGLGCGKGITPLHALSIHGCYKLVKIILSESLININT